MKFSKEQLSEYNTYSLRVIAREMGVKAPTSLTKTALIEEILLIDSGQKSPVKPTKKGRPYKNYLENIIIEKTQTRTDAKQEKEKIEQKKKEIIDIILKEVEAKLTKLLSKV